ncbi:hypothetical protein AiwAL_03335 [Acidiphilium sp. AL]|uniref:Uncharacterized protein n=1 Tax=Acidiphilium iwatense TaxID=768198 RepID=A0ABS9DTH2_9PROT|nr:MULTISPECIES: hypothetical protein [Acidiphilium]MCF3945984.1 hypothetical protein [Acidiphilium iwatense]MCU4159136.1 hypothetical protein [Acidiphilium sp. AL]
MTKTTRVIVLLAGLGVAAPMIASAAPFFTPHAKLVQEINQSYGTQFKVPGQSAHMAAAPHKVTPHKG